MKNRILEVLKRADKRTVSELMRELDISPSDRKLFYELLDELKDECLICQKGDFYMHTTKADKEVGTIIYSKDKKWFINTTTNKQIRVHNIDKNCLPGDVIMFTRYNAHGVNNIVVDSFLKHGDNKIAFVNTEEGLVPYNDNFYLDVDLSKIDVENLVIGEIVLLELVYTNNGYNAKMISKVGHIDDPNLEIKLIAVGNGFTIDFSNEAYKEADNLPQKVETKDIKNRSYIKKKEKILLNDRVDLRDKIIFTIDSAHTKDMDDAVSLEILSNGNYKLGVHIADVSNYVKYGSKLYSEASERATSVYLANTVIPMLPHSISNGICSLNPNVDRLTITCEMEIDQKGNIVQSNIYESVINSRKKMTYEDVNKILENGEYIESYEPYLKILNDMKKLANLINKDRIRRGAIEFYSRDMFVNVLDDENIVIDCIENKTAEKIIENFMISANETVSEFISHYDTSFIYRIHDKPEKEVIDEIIDKIALLGYKIKKCNNLNLQKTISSISNDPAYPVLSDMILKGMKRAKYDDYNIGHFALASNYYTHFTSPIRRFPDLLVHSILKNIMHEGVNKIDGDYIHDMAFHSSVKERCAEKAEKEVNEYMCAKYMTKHIGEEVIGVITNIKNDYMEVQTNNMIRGKVMYIDKKCKIGDKVLLVCTDASKHTKSICFDVKNIIVDDEKKLKLSM